MNLRIQQSFSLHSVRLLTLLLLFVASSSVVSQAGVMLAEFEPGSTVVDAGTLPVPDADDEDPKLILSSDQEYGMSRTSTGGTGVTFLAVSLPNYQLAQRHLVQWLATQCRLMIPNPIPISLLKVPIEVV